MDAQIFKNYVVSISFEVEIIKSILFCSHLINGTLIAQLTGTITAYTIFIAHNAKIVGYSIGIFETEKMFFIYTLIPIFLINMVINGAKFEGYFLNNSFVGPKLKSFSIFFDGSEYICIFCVRDSWFLHG